MTSSDSYINSLDDRMQSVSRDFDNTTPIDSLDKPAVFTNPLFGQAPANPTNGENPDYLKLILTANGIYNVAIETPLTSAPLLSNKTDNIVLLKREDLQPVFSFKIRGAYNKMSHLSQKEREKGVVACSAGNHAQGVALSAARLGINATIVMPMTTPPIKYENVKRLGGNVVLAGKDFYDAKAEAARLENVEGYTPVSPYDDPYVIAGQGTIAMEIIHQAKEQEIHAIFVPVGGGGLIAGVASYIKRISPKTRIVGVETFDADALTQSLKKGEKVTLDSVGLFADGTAVRRIGDYTFDICQEFVDETVLVSTDEICAAIKDAFEDTRSLLEPSGALSIAGLKRYAQEKNLNGQRLIAITSGANVSFDRLRFISERTYIGADKEVLFAIKIPERPGTFFSLYKTIEPRDVTEFSYRYSDDNEAFVFMAFSIKDRKKDLPAIVKRMKDINMTPYDVTNDEIAKIHMRHLVGGKNDIPNERLFRFSFPEVPGALGHFLKLVNNPKWNISLFHYRNNGGDVAKILVGIQVPESTSAEFSNFLKCLGYPYIEETDNEVYKLFLK